MAKPWGTIGDIGVYSFDFVKTITAGEGGAKVSNKQTFKTKADAFQDHGHDHLGKNRGLDKPLFLGYNYRISELHAAVGLAQLRKLDLIIERQKKNKNILKGTLKGIEGLKFRRIVDPKGENAGFLSLIFPNKVATTKALKLMQEHGIEGCFYWFSHQWYYLQSWEHLFELKSLNPLPQPTYDKWKKESHRDFSVSNNVMERTLSILIKQNWSDLEVMSLAQNLKLIVTKSLKNVKIQKHSASP
jgi:8-amino-3,8-dideoxy-alpha-D-manno-octulosonate transaminase